MMPTAMPLRRLFIAIPLPAGLRAELERAVADDVTRTPEPYRDMRMLPAEQWHFTLVFLGDQPADMIPAIEHAIANALSTIASPAISIDSIATAPPGRPARMVWITANDQASRAMGAVKTAIEDALERNRVVYAREDRQFQGHITIARIRPNGRPPVTYRRDFKDALSFSPTSVLLMESVLAREGARYATIAQMDFADAI